MGTTCVRHDENKKQIQNLEDKPQEKRPL